MPTRSHAPGSETAQAAVSVRSVCVGCWSGRLGGPPPHVHVTQRSSVEWLKNKLAATGSSLLHPEHGPFCATSSRLALKVTPFDRKQCEKEAGDSLEQKKLKQCFQEVL